MTLWILLMMPSRSMKSAGVGTCALDRQESAGKEVLPMAPMKPFVITNGRWRSDSTAGSKKNLAVRMSGFGV